MEPVTRVQRLADAGVEQVPPQYIQPLDHRPINSTDHVHREFTNIPLIDFANDRDSLRREICHVCREWGAFHVINHGIPVEILRQIRSVGRSFFEDYSMADKLKYACDPNSAASEGYGSKMLVNDGVLDWRDYFDHHTLPLARRNPSLWPEFPSDYRRVVAEYSDKTKELAQKLLGVISESLGLRSSFIEDAVGEFYQNITISYYPPCPQPDLTLGLQSHSDMGALTLLVQDDEVEGLQVLKDGDWVTVEPLSDAIVVLLADQTEIITNGEYISAQHRAITNANRARLSVATFHDPGKTVKISPTRELYGESTPACYRAVVYGDYVSSWYTQGPEGKRNLDALLLSS